MNGEQLSIEVSCEMKYMKLYEYIKVSPNAVYTVTKDIFGFEVIPSGIVGLESEKNI